MGIKLNKIVYAVIILLISCKDIAQKNSISTSSKQLKITQESIDFFDKKYFTGYELAIDESNMSEHPIYSYLDCKNGNYFSVHFIPKKSYDREFWKNEYYKNVDFNTYDFRKDSKKIESIIGKKLNDYNVFSYLINKKNLNYQKKCTVENISLNKNSEVEIYLYNYQTKNWDLIKIEKSSILPPYANNVFFTSRFPELFTNLKDANNSSVKILQEYDYDLNSDGIKDKVILYQNNEEKGEFEKNHFGLPMVIKKGLANKSYQTWYENDLIIPKNNFNCAAEGFDRIVFKGNYFTIEDYICSDYISISTYTTFKVVENKIFLHKYSETYFDKANHEKKIPAKTWGIKDFQSISFGDVTDDFLGKLRQTKPKK